ncbi:hypothetical protein BH20CHL8_BH20CHL8_06900 [soil metagenome]
MVGYWQEIAEEGRAMLTTPLCRTLGIEHPIISAAMGGATVFVGGIFLAGGVLATGIGLLRTPRA